ncbi:alpha-amylase family glycosyl hydrolase [Ahniella affigens]|nr:alpha-amylase family glycosyl hydrolase [Ahniella affigens]
MNSYARIGLLTAALSLTPLAPASNAAQQKQHSADRIDWRDQVIYFVMIDRFADGDPDNNDQGTGEYDSKDGRKFSGGDLAGIAQQLDYIEGLGATALWITPPVANQWWDSNVQFGGYHGYWAQDFKHVDAHFGDLQAYRALGQQLDQRGMQLVQDVVVNHVGNYFGYADPMAYDAQHREQGFRRYRDGEGRSAPSQAPFDQNDVNDPKQRAAAIYHFTPPIRSHQDQQQEWDWQLADLDDLNTENRTVRRALRDSYGYWMREVGVDAFRVDTAFYVPPEYFEDFLFARDRKAPGIMRLAKSLGKPEFHVFGEGFGIDAPFTDAAARRIDAYMRGTKGERRMPGMINFPLYGSLLDVFARGQGTDVLAHRIESMMEVHENPHLMPTFVDNHDVDRFLAGGSVAGLHQALMSIFALPGIPTIYYGTEQQFRLQRGSMFASGVESGGQNHFNRDVTTYQLIRKLADLRRDHVALRRGQPTVLHRSASAGAMAWLMSAGENENLVLLNSADAPRLLVADTKLPAGSRWVSVFSLDGQTHSTVLQADGRLSVELPARSGMVMVVQSDVRAKVVPCGPIALDTVQADAAGDLRVAGHADSKQDLLLVLDGALDQAQAVTTDANGAFQAQVATDSWIDPTQPHALWAYRSTDGCSSAIQAIKTHRPWQDIAAVDDPAGDDTGPSGDYEYPADRGYRTRPGDIRHMQVSRSGRALRIHLQMADIVQQWQPANGFDHVAFTAFFEIPGAPGGVRAMPLQFADLPDDMRWHRRWRAHGWSNSLFSSAGASAEREGQGLDQGARIAVDAAGKSVSITIPAAAFGDIASLEGMRLYVNTWDYDGGYRGISAEGRGLSFRSQNATDASPRVLDAIGPIELRE